MNDSSVKTRGLALTCSIAAISMMVLMIGCGDPTKGVQSTEGVDEKPVTEVVVVGDGTALSYTIDKDASIIDFTGTKQPGISHSGGWLEYEGKVVIPDGDFTKASITIEIDINSMHSDDKDLTTTLLSDKLFDGENFPTASFASTGMEKKDDVYAVSGNFTLRGVTKNITFDAKVTTSDSQVTAESEFVLNRKDFGLNYDGMAGSIIRDEVVMIFYIEANVAE